MYHYHYHTALYHVQQKYPLFGFHQSLWWDIWPFEQCKEFFNDKILVCTPPLISVLWKKRILRRTYKFSISCSEYYLRIGDITHLIADFWLWFPWHCIIKMGGNCYNLRVHIALFFCFCAPIWYFQGLAMQRTMTNHLDIGYPITVDGWFSSLYQHFPKWTYCRKHGEKFLSILFLFGGRSRNFEMVRVSVVLLFSDTIDSKFSW